MQMLITIDFETYWDTEYTLSKLTTEEYVRSPKYKTHMVGVKFGDRETKVYDHEEFQILCLNTNWGDHSILCQNTAFDGLILAHHYDVRPKFWLDTMSMFRAIHPDKRASLKVIAETLGLEAKGGKGGYDIVNTRGKQTLTPAEYAACAEYCKLDVDLAYKAFKLLLPHTTMFELRLIDQTIRFFTEPVLHLNPKPLVDEVKAERERKAALLAQIEEDRDLLSSNQKFAVLLESHGVTPPVKVSPTAVKKDPTIKDRLEQLDHIPSRADLEEMGIPWAFAFGKTDSAMKALQQHDNPVVQALVAARLGVKSTVSETRAITLFKASYRGAFPIQLNYAAAHTSRWGGTGKVNVQNLPRGSRLREAFVAPKGYKLVVCDLANIEGRVNAYLAGQADALAVFRSGGDIYCDMASTIYQREITKKDKMERQTGKVVILAAGYGMSYRKFADTQYLSFGVLFDAPMAEAIGVSIDGYASRNMRIAHKTKPLTLTVEQWIIHLAVSEYLIKTYRSKNSNIVDFWKRGNYALEAMLLGDEYWFDTQHIIKTSKNQLNAPVGNPIRYVGLKKEGRDFVKRSKEGETRLHSAVLVENAVQWLSRHILAEQALQLQDEGLKIAFTCHDEIVGVAPESDAEYWRERMVEVMSTTPSWMPGLPLAAEASTGYNYGEAK